MGMSPQAGKKRYGERQEAGRDGLYEYRVDRVADMEEHGA